MKISTKLIFGFLLVALVSSVPLYFTLEAYSSINSSFDLVMNDPVPMIKTLDDLKYSGVRIVSSTMEYAFIIDQSDKSNRYELAGTEEKLIAEGRKNFEEALKNYEALVPEDASPEELAFGNSIRSSGRGLIETGAEIVEMKRSGASHKEILDKKEEFEEFEMTYVQAIDTALSYEYDEFNRGQNDVHSTIAGSTRAAFIVSGLAFLIALFLGLYLARLIAKPIGRLKEASERVGDGELDTLIPIGAKDEIGDLSRSFNRMITDLNVSRGDLTAAKIFTEKVLDSMVDFVVVTDLNMKVTKVNKSTLRLTGYEEQELVGKLVNSLMADRPFKQRGVDILRKNGFAANLDKIILNKDGTTTPVSMSLSVFKDDEGNDLGIVCVGKDISERKRAEAEREVISEIIHGVNSSSNLDELLRLIHRSIGRILYAENCYVALYDAKTDLLSVPFCIDKYDEPASPAKLGTGLTAYVLRAGKPRLLTADTIRELNEKGDIAIVGTKPAVWLGVPLTTPEGIIGVLVVQHYENVNAYIKQDVAFLSSVGDQIALVIERKRAEDMLRESEERMRLKTAALESTANGVAITDHRGTIEWVNPAFTQLTGYSAEEAIGQNPRVLKSGKNSKSFYKNLWKTIIKGSIWNGEIVNRRKNGQFYDEEMTIAPVRDSSGAIAHFVAIKQDITGRKQAEEKLNVFNEKLQQSNRELQDFAYVASHDLQEPLRKVQAFSDRLKTRYSDKLEGDGLDYLERMRSAASRMQLLIQDLLTFSRVSTKAHPFGPVDLETLTHEVLSDLEVKIEETHATVELIGLPTIDADRMQMRQLMQNLIGNALKFRQNDVAPFISVRARPLESNGSGANGNLEICVKDNGIGFDEKYTDKIFAVFQRLHGRSEYEGSGVGLAICRKIAERHNGTIMAHSRPGEGSTFIVTLPTKQEKVEIN